MEPSDADKAARIARVRELAAEAQVSASAERCCEIAFELGAMGSLDMAIRCLEKAINLRPDRLELYTFLAQHLVLKGDYDRLNDINVLRQRIWKDRTRRTNPASLGIRFLRTKGWLDCVGQIAHLDVLVKLRVLGLLPPHQHILVIERQHVPNEAYLKYWRRYFPLAISDPALIESMRPMFECLEESGSVIELVGDRFLIITHAMRVAEDMWRAQGRNPALLALSCEDEERGRLRLAELGVDSGSWFVALHVRKTVQNETRNADIATYRMAIETITRRGGWVIRTGDPKMPALPAMPQVIDYAHSPMRADWMDVFLWARSHFFIGCNSGPVQCAATFGTPVICTNMAPHPSRPYLDARGLYLPKLYWSDQKSAYLTFAESYRDPRCYARDPRFTRGIRFVDNTPEEINEVVKEMLDRLDGVAEYSEHDRELQRRFDALVPPVRHICGGTTAIGRDFLRRYERLLEDQTVDPAVPLAPNTTAGCPSDRR